MLDNRVTVDDMTYRTDLGLDRHPINSIEHTQNRKSEQVLGKNHDPAGKITKYISKENFDKPSNFYNPS